MKKMKVNTMKRTIIVSALILVCIACIPPISGLNLDNPAIWHYHATGPGGWIVQLNMTPIINPNTGLPYSSEAEYMQDNYPDQWAVTTPEGRANEYASPALRDGGGAYPMTLSPNISISDSQMDRIIAENMTIAEVYAWLAPDFWAAVVYIGDDDNPTWADEWVQYGDPSASAGTSDPAIKMEDGTVIPLDSQEAKSMFTEQQIRFLEGKIPFDSPEMKSILGEQQWNDINNFNLAEKTAKTTSPFEASIIMPTTNAITSKNQPFQSMPASDASSPNIQAFQSVSGKGFGTVPPVKDSNTGSSASLIKNLKHSTS
jgi:hypothetical protein